MNGDVVVRGRARGPALLEDPLVNRGTAFTEDERGRSGLHGLLPPHVETLEDQALRAWQQVQAAPDDLARHVVLRALQDTNEVLFYRVLSEHVRETLPLVYTPTVGAACEQFSRIYRRSRGLFVSYPDRHRLLEVLRNRPVRDVDVIVVTDGERILGLGDQGVGGMGIPVGKLSLYTLVGGIAPDRTLPIVLDVGTSNTALIDDPAYLGWRHERIVGDDYLAFVDAFVDAVTAELPGVLLQFEDFASTHALPLLDRYRNRLLTFNDDIQGTAAVVVGALTAAVTTSGTPMDDQRIVMLGAGSAGIGVADRLVQLMGTAGVTEADAVARVFVVDRTGLLVSGREDLSDAQRRYAKTPDQLSEWRDVAPAPGGGPALDLAAVVSQVHPTVLIGLSTATGAFTEDIVRDMAAHADRPIIFPLSNPTSRSEAVPQDLSDWTGGRALIATGSPFPPVSRDGREVVVSQCNNVFIFPAVGLGVVASRATRVTDSMLLAASVALGAASPIHRDPSAPLLPDVEELPHVAVTIAEAVARQAVEDGVAPVLDARELARAVRGARWSPTYGPPLSDGAGPG